MGIGVDLHNSCHIRRARIEDAEAVVQGINTVCAEGGAFFTSHFIPSPSWEAVLYHPSSVPTHLLAVVECDGHFAGAGRLFPGPGHSFFTHVVELGMFVLKSYRHQGVGKQLLGWMLNWATVAGFEKVTLSVFATNKPAINLYTHFGFVEEGCLQRHLRVEGQYVDLLLMGVFLS